MLATQRLTLRPIALSDLDQVWVMADDFEVVRHTGTWPWPADREFTASRCGAGFTDTGGWLVALNGDDLVGTIGLKHDGDLGYMLARAYWGQGYATEMGHAVVNHARRSARWDMLKACVFDDNPASGRVLEKLGFVQGPNCVGHCEARDGDFAILTYTMALKS